MEKVAIDLKGSGVAIIALLICLQLIPLAGAEDLAVQGPLPLAAETTVLATAENSAPPASTKIPQILPDATRDTVTEKIVTMKA